MGCVRVSVACARDMDRGPVTIRRGPSRRLKVGFHVKQIIESNFYKLYISFDMRILSQNRLSVGPGPPRDGHVLT